MIRRLVWRRLAVKAVRRWVAATLAIGVVLSLAADAAWKSWREHAGDPTNALADDWFQGHRVLDRSGEILREFPAGEGHRGIYVPLEQMGDRLLAATLAAEDSEFFAHDGVDRVAIVRAVEQNVRHGKVISGASTITQQLVKLLDTRGVPGQRDFSVKLREAARAQNLERRLSKPEILEAYMNRLPYGHGLTGPEAAAQAYFGVTSAALSWGQAAFLAVLPRAPSYLEPYRHPERVRLRQRALLHAMHADAVIDAKTRDTALHEAIVLVPLAHPFQAPHFVQMLRARRMLARKGPTRTSIDATLQQDAEGLVRTHMATLADRSAGDAAAIIIDNATGNVLTYVGSADFHDPEISGQVDMVRARRQPGSTLKPFVYAQAFERGTTGSTMLADVPTEFSEGSGALYVPQNFDRGFVGPISAREALAASLNVPVVRLAAQMGEGELLEFLHRFGFESLDQPATYYGLSLALGSGEVSLEELATAYVALARGGERIPLRYVADEKPVVGERIVGPAIAAAVTDALSDPLARVRLVQGHSPFDIGYPLALKTGTSSGYRDAWTVGFTRERTVAVWIGNADGSATRSVTGAAGAGPLFADLMRRAMDDVLTRAPLWEREELVRHPVCPLSGHRAGPDCPATVHRHFAASHAPETVCQIHRRATRAEDGWRCSPEGEDTVAVLPPAFDDWLETMPEGAPGKDAYAIPWIAGANIRACGEATVGPPTLRIGSPASGSVFSLAHDGADQDRLVFRARWPSNAGAADKIVVEFVLDGLVVARSRGPNFEASVAVGPGDHELYARPADGALPVVFEPTYFSVH